MPTVYNGLFYESNQVIWAHSGSVSLTVDKNAFTGVLTLQGVPYILTGDLDANGQVAGTVERNNATPLNLQIGVTSNSLSGSVSDGHWTSQLQGEAAVSAINGPAEYALYLNGVKSGSLVISNNVALLSTTFTEGANLNLQSGISASGQWPIYQDLLQGQGGILGWLQIGTTNINGTAVWVEPGSTKLLPVIGQPELPNQ
jgi:hypothetical protein